MPSIAGGIIIAAIVAGVFGFGFALVADSGRAYGQRGCGRAMMIIAAVAALYLVFLEADSTLSRGLLQHSR